MYQDGSQARVIKRLFILVIVVGVVFLAYTTYHTVHIVHTTGVLEVSTPQDKSLISISSVDTDAEIVGTGEANIRVRPGVYLVVARNNGSSINTTVQILSQRTTKISLNPKISTTVLPSAQTKFKNTDALVDNGMSSQEVSNVEQLLLSFDATAKVITIDTSSITVGSYDPNSPNPIAPIVFDVTIDSTTYDASVLAAGDESDNATLTLKNPSTNTQVYQGDSSSLGG